MSKRNIKLGKKYAAALFESVGIAQAPKTLELLTRLSTAFSTSSDLRLSLINPTISAKSKKEALSSIAGSSASKEFVSFLSLIVESGRVENLPEITESFNSIVEEIEKLARVEVKSRYTLGADQKEKLTNELKKVFGSSPVVNYSTSPDLLGGMVVKIGDKEFDASFSGALKRLAGALTK